MTASRSDTNGQSANVKPPIVTIAVVVSLCIVFLDSSTRILRNLPIASSFSSLLSPMAPLLCALVLLYLICYLIIVYPARRVLKVDATASAVALAILIALICLLVVLDNQTRYTFKIGELARLALLSGLTLILLYFSASSLLVVKYIIRKPMLCNILARLSLAGPLIIAEALIALWLNNYHFKFFFAAPTLLANAAFALCAVLITVIFLRVGQIRKIVSTVYIFALVTMVSSVAALSAEPIRQSSLRQTIRTGHSVKHTILIIIDTLRADALSCYEGQSIQTPNIDELAQDGIIFNKAFVPAPWTLPSVASSMTGLPAAVHMATGSRSRLPDNFETLAEYLHKAGYLTAAIGKNKFLGGNHNISQGFVEYNFFPKPKSTSLGNLLLKTLLPKRFKANVSTADLANLTIDWLDTNIHNDFFLWVHFFDPHMPYSPPAEFLPPSLEPQPRIGRNFNRLKSIRGGYLVPTLEERRWIKKLYESEVRYVDANVGRVLDHLKQLGIYDESLIILTSDHGEEFWEHNGFEHGHNVYTEAIRVPLIIKLPGNLQKQMIPKPVSTESIMPTILELCGIQYNRDYLSSRGLTELWEKPLEVETYEPIVSTGLLYYEDRIAVIFDGLKYIRWLLTGREELYDLASDPDEKRCIAEQFPEKIQRARGVLAEHIKKAEKLKQHYKVSKGEEAVLDKETLQQLKSLGYVE